MTYAKAFKHVSWETIVDMFAKNKSEQVMIPLRKFMSRKHHLNDEVIKGMIFYILYANHGMLPLKESYYRKTQEDWVERKIETIEVMLDYFNESKHIRLQQEEQRKLQRESIQKMKQKYLDQQAKIVQSTHIDSQTEQVLDNIYKRLL